MGLKSREIDHLLIRQLKLTANKPVTKPALLRTVSRWAHKLISCYNSSILSKVESNNKFKTISNQKDKHSSVLRITVIAGCNTRYFLEYKTEILHIRITQLTGYAGRYGIGFQ